MGRAGCPGFVSPFERYFRADLELYFQINFLEDLSPFRGITDTPDLDLGTYALGLKAMLSRLCVPPNHLWCNTF